MGPRLLRRGIRSLDSASRRRCTRFNGAAPTQARNIVAQRRRRIDALGFNGAAPTQARNMRVYNSPTERGGFASMGPRLLRRGILHAPHNIALARICASMGPRLLRRGILLAIDDSEDDEHPASMGPRLLRRGIAVGRIVPVLDQRASMGPRLLRRGIVSASGVFFDEICYRFNGAAPTQARNNPDQREGPARNAVLQWGRAYSGAEYRRLRHDADIGVACFNGAAPTQARNSVTRKYLIFKELREALRAAAGIMLKSSSARCPIARLSFIFKAFSAASGRRGFHVTLPLACVSAFRSRHSGRPRH